MKESADVTVVIPNYNGIEYVDGCLKSLYEGSRSEERRVGKECRL